MPSEAIKKYTVTYYSGGKNPTGYGYYLRAEIHLRGNNDKWLAVLSFHRSPDTMPDTDSLTGDGAKGCHYRWEDFPQVLDLLRNEKPLYFGWGSQGQTFAGITTAKEPVGEGEEDL